MKKICFVTTISATLKSFVLPTADMLVREGYDVTFICDKDESFLGMLPSGVKYIPVDMKRGVNLDMFRCIKELKRIFLKEQFDLIQFSTPNASLYASIAAKQAKVPIRLYAQWGIRYVGFAGAKRLLFKMLEKVVCNNATAIRAVSPKNMAFAIEEGLYSPQKAKVLGKGGTIGVDLSDYDIENKNAHAEALREEYNLQEDFVFGFVGRFSKDKGSNELLGAFRKIAQEENCTLLCVGEDEVDKTIDEELYQWALTSDKVVFVGELEPQEVTRFYSVMNCYVHPTYREGFGMVLQEAAAMGCPIITTDIPGASEVMEEGQSCMLAKPRDEQSLYLRMKEMMANSELSKQMGAKARERVETYFDRKIMLQNQMEDYKELLK